MAQGDKSKYTDKQKRKAEHIEEGYEERGVPKKEAEERAWRTVNAQDKGGKEVSNRSSTKSGWRQVRGRDRARWLEKALKMPPPSTAVVAQDQGARVN